MSVPIRAIIVDSATDFFEYDLLDLLLELGLDEEEVLILQPSYADQALEVSLKPDVAVLCCSFRNEFSVADTFGQKILQACGKASLCGMSGDGNHFSEGIFADFIARDFDLSQNPKRIRNFFIGALSLETAS